MNGTYFQKTASKPYPTDWTLRWGETLLLIGSGITAVLLHRAFDLSLGLPGHHGMDGAIADGTLVLALSWGRDDHQP